MNDSSIGYAIILTQKGAIKQDSTGKVLMIHTCSTEEHMHTDTDTYMGQTHS